MMMSTFNMSIGGINENSNPPPVYALSYVQIFTYQLYTSG